MQESDPARFALDWLDLRAAADDAARSADLARRFAASLPPQPRLLDLASGAGANPRHLGPILIASGRTPRWRLLDADPALLATAARRCENVETRVADLAGGLPAEALDAVDGVATTAFLDLVSAPFLEALAARLAARRLPFLATLTCDGRDAWHPADPEDGAVAAAFAAHQRRDKGFGPALGPDAGGFLADRLRGLGYAVTTAPAPWRLHGDDGALMAALVEGTARAASEAAPEAAARIAGWASRRHQALRGGVLQVEIGHLDLLALPGRAPQAR